MNRKKANPKVIFWFSLVIILLLFITIIIGVLNLTKNNKVDKVELWKQAKNIKGDPNSKIQVVVFNDYKCPHCYDFNKETKNGKLKSYINNGDIAYTTINHPIVNQSSKDFAHMDDLISKNVNNKIYWQFHDKAYNVESPKDALNTLNISEGLKQKLKNNYYHIRSKDYTTKKNEELFNINETPTIFVNGIEVKNKDEIIKSIEKIKK